jgi:hypothetical protein
MGQRLVEEHDRASLGQHDVDLAVTAGHRPLARLHRGR